MHVTTVRFHLQILERAGMVRSRPRPRGGSGRPRTVYLATAEVEGHSGEGAYRDLAAVLAAHLDVTAGGRAARAQRAGESWAGHITPDGPPPGDAAEAVDRVRRLCSELGFDPELAPDGEGWRIHLRACPFRPVARAHPEVVCSVHLGLIRGTLDRGGCPRLGADLVPFVEPELCIVHLGAVDQPGGGRPAARG